MATSKYSFPKSDRLCSHTIIEELFSKGQSFVSYPFRVIYISVESLEDAQSQVMFSVSKKRFKRAVHRNLLKRRCKEAYRLNREEFSNYLTEADQQIAFAMVYISGDQLSYKVIEKGIKKALVKLKESLSKNEDKKLSV